MQELIRKFGQDPELNNAIAAIFMDETDYVDAAQYFADGVRKLRLLKLQQERALAQGTLNQYAKQEIYLSQEEMRELLKKITELDTRIQRLKQGG